MTDSPMAASRRREPGNVSIRTTPIVWMQIQRSSGRRSMVWQTQFDRLPIREVDDLLEREAVDFHANRLWSDARGKQRRRYLRQTLIFAQRDGKHRQVQLRLLL